jgi:hypothetical protein
MVRMKVRMIHPAAVILSAGSVATVPDPLGDKLIRDGDAERVEDERADEPQGQLETRSQ